MPSRESQTVKFCIEVSGPTALGDAVASTRRFAVDQALGVRDQTRLCVIVEELIANLLEHGAGETRFGLEVARNVSSITLTIDDGGSVFDPRTAPDDPGIPERGGGAGLRLVNAWSEVVGYDSAGGRNRLQLSMPLTDS